VQPKYLPLKYSTFWTKRMRRKFKLKKTQKCSKKALAETLNSKIFVFSMREDSPKYLKISALKLRMGKR